MRSAAFEAALAADPSQTELARRVEVLKFRNVEQGLARARDAARRPDALDEAVQAYTAAIASSPDSAVSVSRAGRRRAAERRQRDAALEHFRKAVGAGSRAMRGRSRRSARFSRAAATSRARPRPTPIRWRSSRTPTWRSGSRRSRARRRWRGCRPSTAPSIRRAQITRARSGGADRRAARRRCCRAARRSDAALITDVRTNWAATWIMAVARAGVMEPFANHAFQPRTVVRRTDLAQAVARLLARIAGPNAARARGWESARLKFTDLSPSHLAYPAASAAVAVRRDETDRGQRVSAVAAGHRRRSDRGDRRRSRRLRGTADDRADAGEPAHAAADAADPGVRDPRASTGISAGR